MEFAGFLDTKIIQERDQDGGGNGDELTVTNGKRPGDEGVREEAENRERPEDADQAGGDGRNRRRLGNEESCPGIEKSGERAVTVANINVFAPGLRLHCPQFSISERAKEREQTTDEPCQIDKFGGADSLHHFGGNQENPAADDGANNDRSGVAYAEIAGEFGARRGCHLGCSIREGIRNKS